MEKRFLLLFLGLTLAAPGAPLWIDKGMPVPANLRVGRFANCCGSMRPYVTGGETYYFEPYLHGKTALRLGDWLVLYREIDGALVGHELTAMNPRAVYTSGTANKYSDGWTVRGNIIGVIRIVVRKSR
jgi:hypothetical protein